jgi:signal transduction histidine kinase
MQNHLIDRLTALPNFSKISQNEIRWLVKHGRFEIYDVGTIVGPNGNIVKYLWIVLSGNIAIRVDHGAGAKQVTEWRRGDVTGMLPYSRMTAPPGDNYAKEEAELLSISVSLFPEMIRECPSFTAYTVHSMIDRARNFNTKALQDEKMISLGKLASGLAHELNNPASAAIRDSKLITDSLDNLNDASWELGVIGLTDQQIKKIKQLHTTCLERTKNTSLSPIEKVDYQEEITDWLIQQGLNTALALPLTDTLISIQELEKLVSSIPEKAIEKVLKWILANYTVYSLAIDMEHCSNQIYKLVDSVKKFTYMDNLADKELIEIEPGIRNTIDVLASKVKLKNAYIKFETDENIPLVYAKGSDLNQVWLCLLDNALDAIPIEGKILINICSLLTRVEIRIIDNGQGIPEDKIPRIFDAFYTTKPPGHGVGLGLDLARRILSRYDGEISVQSNPGRTEFIVSLVSEENKNN